MNNVLERLLEGNRRFSLGQAVRPDSDIARRQQIAGAQKPFALILSCSDSRVPPEIVFDCGLGDLFVIRTAGHTVDNAVRESVLFGIQALRIPLVLVLGHARCGAVSLAIQAKQSGASHDEPSWVAAQIAPAVEECKNAANPLDCAIRTHANMTVGRLKDLLMPVADSVPVLGAYYDLDTGVVELLNT
ncbi:MAG: carbonic anhydrase [Anaerolineales bacterium]|nr:carbonic anhydrase [Anaerolineales bacterium]